MQAYKGLNTSTNVWSPVLLDDYEEAVIYDPNGNILTYVRAGAPEKSLPAGMDKLTYNYYSNTNRLHYVDDIVSAGNYTEDIDDQSSGNYTYDAIGNLKTDAAEGITRIGWTAYGKIDTIVKSGDDIYYTYDASGNRITKKVGNKTTVYVRDAQGNVLSVYEKISLHALEQVETHVYGSKRLGILGKLTAAPSTISLAGGYGTAKLSTFRRGEKFFELSNHLGNVLTTVTDRKLQHHDGGGGIDYYTADVATANDYYPFGMGMPGRKYAASDVYRYGFNGKENDNEVKGEGNQQDYGFRIYDPRLGKFLSVDPLNGDYPWYTPYQFAGNKPISFIDLDGLEEAPATNGSQEGERQTTSKTDYARLHNIPKTTTKVWFWHGGGIFKRIDYDQKTKQYVNVFSRSGWYSQDDYRETLQAGPNGGLAGELAGYLGYYNQAAGDNWKAEEKANFLNSKVGQFLNNISNEGANQLAIAAKDYANDRNLYVSGLINPSSFNVEDMVGVGLLLKATIKALASTVAKEGLDIFTHGLKYAPRVRQRALEDPISHNFPYSFDDAILSTQPILKKDGYKIYQLKGTLHGKTKIVDEKNIQEIKEGVFEIGVTKDGVIDHRCFRSN